MAPGYKMVNVHEEEYDEETLLRSPVEAPSNNRLGQPHVPHSPPPSFHSRSSSPNRRNGTVDAALADAFDDDDSDDEADDRQRLVRQNSTPSVAPQASSSQSRTGHSLAQPSTAPVIRSPRILGGGSGTDGVFANMSARPERTESEKDEQPPTYEQAAADAVPPYWETTILAPGLGGFDEVFVDGLPVGSVFSFIWNGIISAAFQLVGFLLTYLLHSTHAAKNGSLAGLGVTLIQYGFKIKSGPGDAPNMGGPDGYAAPPDPNSHNFQAQEVTEGRGRGLGDITGSEWMAYVLMVVGWFILIKSIAEFMKARRHEMLVLQSPDRGLGIPIIADGESSERAV
ncbi:unnamed protein product [Clonostachys rosea f. rosea IK726]|uniref:Metal homeostatis protein bsd2 n=2 Tax=Bionectria ochroleuca TaxID=29856 RepID=A0A0B7KBT0_BIOOC|nr:unnamed protein product [Clonostachys rosea f. rosea IK726]